MPSSKHRLWPCRQAASRKTVMALRIHRKAEGRLRKDRTRGACGGCREQEPPMAVPSQCCGVLWPHPALFHAASVPD